MKKLLPLTLVVLTLVFVLASCGGKQVPPTTQPPVHEHTIVIDEAVAPTCASTGLTEGQHCSDCGEILIAQTEIPHYASYRGDYPRG